MWTELVLWWSPVCWAQLEQAASGLRVLQVDPVTREGERPSTLVTQGQCAAWGLARSSERNSSCGAAACSGWRHEARPGPSLPGAPPRSLPDTRASIFLRPLRVSCLGSGQ